ncbi:MAG: hypothetical protein CVU27_08595 [Betaproteobacteria bacterium HGW-Betaproteobacteria-20]|jgi:uncharacterized short protein YbdD (DUF466 family)|nr:MAG: hypothetical protein CVU27_08595 [Betaproteobacteria bacterium HGW-Betaproteobacteria-20]
MIKPLMIKPLKNLWRNIRRLSGDDAYEQYLAHYAQHQAALDAENTEPPLSREAFFKEWQDKKWKGVKRCC